MKYNVPKNKQLVLFDGVCNLCNSSVQYVIKHDKANRFMFAALQSKVGQQLIEDFNIDTSKTDSILLYSPGKALAYKSTAALKIALKLGFPRHLMVVFFVVPTFIRNAVYDYIARNRYKWYGKRDHCIIPTPELKSKFLD
ncbi:MAG: thiol-disulfide oxidoreductase DCC family protein [Algicola sp.]|nr:thiol-disulfide oxidoreductase DCC family protein [Algicola sp.]